MNGISELFRAIAEVFGFVNRRTDLKNAKDVREAAKAQDAVNVRSGIENSVANKDTKGTREDLAE